MDGQVRVLDIVCMLYKRILSHTLKGVPVFRRVTVAYLLQICFWRAKANEFTN